MPKSKPHKGLLKRVRVTGRGKVVRRKANKGHLMSTKTGKRRRHLGQPAVVKGTDIKTIRRLLAME